ncbi:hypothetical protein K2P47_01330 [Patescibacteria group bacterium]|nr:hypothetical protein [Patescibacteria group bacterium]
MMGRNLQNELPFSMPRPSKNELLKRLRPNHPDEQLRFGYLGANEDLYQLIEKDRETIKRLNLSYEELASAIERLFQTDDEHVCGNRIFREYYIHSPVCPWGDFCTTGPFGLSLKVTQIFVVNKDCPEGVKTRFVQNSTIPLDYYTMLVKYDWAMIFSDLHPHLIREHHFLEGHETPYRIDPERAVRYLGLS